MAHPLDGARLKVIRAQEHLDSLKAEIGMYLNDHPYVVTPKEQTDPGKGGVVVKVRIPPPLRLSTIIGDCVTNARAALDYIVWELAVRYFTPAFDIKKTEDRRIVSFPIRKDLGDKGYSDHLSRLEKRTIPAAAIAAIETAQSHAGRNGPTLRCLHKIVNDDKHRAPLLTVGDLGNVQFYFPDTVYDIQSSGVRLRTRGGDAGITFDIGTPGTQSHGTEMQVDTQATVYVTWKDVTMPRERVDWTLEEIVKAVANIIPGFDALL